MAITRSRGIFAAGALAAAVGLVAYGSSAVAAGHNQHVATRTPIQHLVVIFQENVSFDHYFGTYPKAANTSGEPFHAAPSTPDVNGLTHALLTNNPNKDVSGTVANPKRYDPSNINDVLTCDQGHDYNAEQQAFDGGAMDKFVTTVGNGSGKSPAGQPCNARDVMNYYDGNTVAGLWNLAQNFAMSDNSFGTTFGPSSPGAINLISGNTGGVDKAINGADTNGDTVSGTVIEDPQPYYDDCSTRDAVSLSGSNVGDLLNAQGISWGWFQGGLTPSTPFATAQKALGRSPTDTATFSPDVFKGQFKVPGASDQGICNTFHPIGAGIGGTGTGTTNYGNKNDYIPHHEPFQYYASTANPHHLAPASLSAIGTDTQSFVNGTPQFDTANHQYDMTAFDSLVGAITKGYISPDKLPAVSFLKAPGYQDGHPGYSDPIDEQQFIAKEINALEQTPDWGHTAVVIAYDDSDGWYDHAYSGIHNTSDTSGVANPPGPQDFLTGTGHCGDTTANPPLGGIMGRCGYGPRLPLLVISPWAKPNYVDHTLTDQSSILAFVESNWKLPKIPNSFDAIAGSLNHMFDFDQHPTAKLYLDPTTGQPYN